MYVCFVHWKTVFLLSGSEASHSSVLLEARSSEDLAAARELFEVLDKDTRKEPDWFDYGDDHCCFQGETRWFVHFSPVLGCRCKHWLEPLYINTWTPRPSLIGWRPLLLGRSMAYCLRSASPRFGISNHSQTKDGSGTLDRFGLEISVHEVCSCY